MNLQESVKGSVANKLTWLGQAIRAQAVVESLPDEVKALEGSVDSNYDGSVSIYLWKGKEATPVLALLGAVFQPATITPYSGEFSSIGRIEWKGQVIQLTVRSLDAPPGCEVAKVTEKVTRYRYKERLARESPNPTS